MGPSTQLVRRNYARRSGAAAAVLFGCVWCSCAPQGKDAPDLITITPAVQEQPRDGLPSGAEVLLRSAQAYLALKTYVGTTSVTDRAGYGHDAARDPTPSKAEAKVWFSRPGKIRIEGKDTSTATIRGHRFWVICDGDATWTAWEIENNGAFKREPILRDAIRRWLGVAAHATIMIPGSLLPIEWERDTLSFPRGQLLPAFATKAVLAGEEKIDGHACFKVVCERDIGTWTFWVDKESFLLRKREHTVSPEQTAVMRTHGVGGGFSGRITATLRTETYTIEKLNEDLDEKLFADPTKGQ